MLGLGQQSSISLTPFGLKGRLRSWPRMRWPMLRRQLAHIHFVIGQRGVRPRSAAQCRRDASYVWILKGEKPGNLPAQVYIKAAKALGITIPSTCLPAPTNKLNGFVRSTVCCGCSGPDLALFLRGVAYSRWSVVWG